MKCIEKIKTCETRMAVAHTHITSINKILTLSKGSVNVCARV